MRPIGAIGATPGAVAPMAPMGETYPRARGVAQVIVEAEREARRRQLADLTELIGLLAGLLLDPPPR